MAQAESEGSSSISVFGNGRGGFFGMDPQIPEGRPDRKDTRTFQFDDINTVVNRIKELRKSVDVSILSQPEIKINSQVDLSLDEFASKFDDEGAGVDLVLYNPLHDFLTHLESGDFSNADKQYRSICRDSKIFRKFNNFLQSMKFIMKRLKVQIESSTPKDLQNTEAVAPRPGRRPSARRPRQRTRPISRRPQGKR